MTGHAPGQTRAGAALKVVYAVAVLLVAAGHLYVAWHTQLSLAQEIRVLAEHVASLRAQAAKIETNQARMATTIGRIDDRVRPAKQ